MTITNMQVERFAALFSGFSKAYGVFNAKKQSGTGKVEGFAATVRTGPPQDAYRRHLIGGGAEGLGIVMLRDDDTCLFGVIDHDDKKMDHVKMEAAIRRLNLPLVLCRSKSGGGHFYVFCEEPVPALVMRGRLAEWTAMLGMSAKTEQFPKQCDRKNPEDIGNWINLPYYGAESTTRYCLVDGAAIDFETFLEYAESKRVSLADMEREWIVASDWFLEGPPCLATLEAQGGFAEGSKRNGMFAVAVYLKKRFADDWETRVDAYNQHMAKIASNEVQGIIKSINKKKYEYTCKTQPLNTVCQKLTCRTREFGIGNNSIDSTDFIVTSVIRYDVAYGDDPMWALEINGKRVFITNPQLYDKHEFNRACMSQAHCMPDPMTPLKWQRQVQQYMAMASIVPLPIDASPTGQLVTWIEAFLTQQVNALTREEVFLGKPYRENGHIFFRSMDLFKYLDARRVPYKSHPHVYDLLRQMKGGTTFWNIRKKGVNVWFVPTQKEEPGEPGEQEGQEGQEEAVPEQSEAF